MLHELVDTDVVEGELGRAGVEAGYLEQVRDHPLEAAQLRGQEIQRPPRPLRKVVSAGFQHADRGRQRRQRRAQLVADVGGEARFALDPLLEPVGHAVERGGERGQVGLVEGLQTGVEAPSGDGDGGVGHVAQRPQRPATGPAADEDAGDGDGDRARSQGEGQDPQRVIELLQREHLEVGGSDDRDRDAHSHLQGTGQVEALTGGRPSGDLAAEVRGESIPADRERGGEPPAAVVQDRARAGCRVQ